MGVFKVSKAEKRGIALQRLNELKRVGIPDAASILEMHPYTLREYIDKGYIRTIPFGARQIVTEEEIRRYMNHGKRNPDE